MKIKTGLLILLTVISTAALADRNLDVMPHLSEEPQQQDPAKKGKKPPTKTQQVKQNVSGNVRHILANGTKQQLKNKQQVLQKLKALTQKVNSTKQNLKHILTAQQRALAKNKAEQSKAAAKKANARQQALKRVVGVTTK